MDEFQKGSFKRDLVTVEIVEAKTLEASHRDMQVVKLALITTQEAAALPSCECGIQSIKKVTEKWRYHKQCHLQTEGALMRRIAKYDIIEVVKGNKTLCSKLNNEYIRVTLLLQERYLY